MTTLMFKYKVQSVIGRIAPPKLQGDVGVGFFDIQSKRDDPYFRMWRKSKKRILLAIEVKDRKVVKAICRIVDDIIPDYARQIIHECVSQTAHLAIASGGVRGFKKMEKEYQSARVYNGWGHLGRYFAGFKQWIDDEFKQRYSFKHLQGYFDEYNFRVNHQCNPQRNFDIVIRAMMKFEHGNQAKDE